MLFVRDSGSSCFPVGSATHQAALGTGYPERGAGAELEREYILQRQKEGIAIAKANGVYKGRKPIERPDLPAVVALWRGGKITATEAMRRLDMKPSTFYRRVKRL